MTKYWMLALIWCALLSSTSLAEEVLTKQVEFKHQGAQLSTIGEVLTEYADGSMLLLTPDGQLRTLLGEDITSAKPADQLMQAMTTEEIGRDLLMELPPGFTIYQTKHYVLAYNTSEIYVKWVGKLFERLHTVFYNYWKTRGLRLEEPRFPLVAIVFSDKASYLTYAEREVGDSAQAMIGYYNMKSNRMIMYDLTGVDGLVPPGGRVSSQAVINQILARPEAERTVATIVHEAVHQLSFNSGLQTRLADNPLWISEGMAMFFESPDNGSAQGWQKIGNVNYHNFRLFARQITSRPADSLSTLISDDTRFSEAKSAAAAYPESWALTYFLFKTKSKQVVDYLKELRELPPLGEVTPRERIEQFKKHFGEDLAKLDREFLDYMRRVR